MPCHVLENADDLHFIRNHVRITFHFIAWSKVA